MEPVLKRIFIGNLPSNTTEDEIKNKFTPYGEISTIELKTKTDANERTTHFAFVSVTIDNRNLQKCFHDIGQNEWQKGTYVNMQMAKESFLDRLKREREEAAQSKDEPSGAVVNNVQPVIKKNDTVARTNVRKYKSSSSDSSDSDSDSPKQTVLKLNTCIVQDEEDSSLIIKNNKGKTLNGHGMRIESVGLAPIFESDGKKRLKSKDPKRSEADAKRIKSMQEMKKGYQLQKSLIQRALATTDKKPNKKIVFNDKPMKQVGRTKGNDDGSAEVQSKFALFDEDNDEEEGSFNFEVREEFSGKQGKKLLEMQSKFNNDKRFAMDSRFLEDGGDEDEEAHDDIPDEDEKRTQFKILEDVIGKPIVSKSLLDKKELKVNKAMLRFDPSIPDHNKYEIKVSKKKQKLKKLAAESVEEVAKPPVSKEQFYKVNDALKQSLQEKDQPFSLMGLFSSQVEEAKDEDNLQSTESAKSVVPPNVVNPFRYDSSDDEDAAMEESPLVTKDGTKNVSWNENLFFAPDDERFKEGLDFMSRLVGEMGPDFYKLRQELKEIARTKVRNNERNRKPFKSKIGSKKIMRKKKGLK